MAEFKTISLADQVYDKLESDIISGVYARGEILTELKLVEALGVSRTPIREALRRLEHERLIEDSGKGSVVLGITLDDLVDIMNIREKIEGLVAYYATKNLTAEGREKLKSINELQEFYYSKHDVSSLRKVDDDFHQTIYALSGRSVLRDTLIPLHRKTQRYRRFAIEDNTRQALSVQEHFGIYEAIMSGNADLAAQRMTQHIAHAKENMIKRLDYNG